MNRIGQKPRRGYTLVEILVAAGIIIALATISVPLITRLKERARAATCAAKLKNLGTAVNLYLGEHNMTFPTMEAARADREDEVAVLDNTLDEYIDGEEVFQCPADDAGLFEETGTSYFWNSLLNGQQASNANLLGLIKSAKGIPVISDKENFHRWRGDEVNILYADGHVDKELRFNVGG